MKKVNKALALVLAAAMMTVTACDALGQRERKLFRSIRIRVGAVRQWGHGDRGGQHSGGRSEHP